MAPSTQWTEETLYTSGDVYFRHLIQSLSHAQSSIQLETYIFLKGVLADRVCRELCTAAARGVKVEVLIDGWGSPHFIVDYYTDLVAAGVRVRFFRAFPWIFRRLPGDPSGLFRRLAWRWRKINRGNHRKFCLIDGLELFVGSFNVADVHLEEVSGEKAWKDIGVRVKGSELRYAARAFQRSFRGWKALNWPMRSPNLLLLNDSYLHKRRTRSAHIERIKLAKERIWLATPYFIPIGRVFRLLKRKARLGVDVRLMIPKYNDVFFMNWISYPLMRELAKSGVTVLVYQPRFAHQKIFIADDWMCVGSTNLNHRSFLHDLEMDVVISHPANKRRLANEYLRDQNESEEFDRSDLATLPWWKKLVSYLFSMLKYWA
ncbi:MAG: phosphatidylserine/phosphatidylglycerophosphate/cardiolipin synthase family protein [Bdellovibrionales bacterium]